MFSKPYSPVIAVAVLGLMKLAAALPTTSQAAASATTTCITDPTEFPDPSKWKTVDEMKDTWGDIWTKSHADTDQEVMDFLGSIDSWAQKAQMYDDKAKAAFFLAVMGAESEGDTTVKCGDGGISCGLFQVKGPGDAITCTQHSCDSGQLDLMVQAGIYGGVAAQTGNNYKDCYSQNGNSYAQAARCYNSGSVKNKENMQDAKWGRKSYVNIVASYLLGATPTSLGIGQGKDLCGISVDS
ncbi:MAG: hypothetical protein Q9159_007657 [Coniocarpon cinnabarinum]